MANEGGFIRGSKVARAAAFKTAAEGRMTFYLPVELARWLRVAAAHRGASTSTVVSVAAREWLARNPPPGYQVPVEDRPSKDTSPAAAAKRAHELSRAGETQAAIAATLNREGYRTRRGKPWNLVSVGRELRRR